MWNETRHSVEQEQKSKVQTGWRRYTRVINPCFLGCLQRASLGRALQVPSAPLRKQHTAKPWECCNYIYPLANCYLKLWKDPPCYFHGKIHYFDWAIFIHFPVRKLFPCISELKVAVDLCTYLFIYMLYSRFLSSNRPETLQSLLPSMFL